MIARLGPLLFARAALIVALSFVGFLLLDRLPRSAHEESVAIDWQEDVRLLRVRGEDRPLFERWACWWVGCEQDPSRHGLLGGELGHSRAFGVPVAELLSERASNTFRLMLPTFFLGLGLTLGLATWATTRRAGSRFLEGLSALLLALPLHWLALLAVLLFAVELRWLPASGVDDPLRPNLGARFWHALLPVALLTTVYGVRWARQLAASLREALGSAHVVAARARGLEETRVLFVHAMKSALLPLVTVVAESIPGMFSGALVIERIFAYPGIGLLLYDSIRAHDHPVALALFVYYALLVFAAGALAEVLHAAVDPRILRPGVKVT